MSATVTPAAVTEVNAAVAAKRAAKVLSPEWFAAGQALLETCERAGVSAKGAMYSTATFAAMSRKGAEVIVGLSNARINERGLWEYEIVRKDLGIFETVDERALTNFVL